MSQNKKELLSLKNKNSNIFDKIKKMAKKVDEIVIPIEMVI